MAANAAIFLLLVLHLNLSDQGSIQSQEGDNNTKFSVGAALRYLSTAIFAKALLQGKSKEVFEDAMTSASHEDSSDCIKRLLCEIQSKANEELAWDENLVKNSISPTIDYSSPHVQFQLAADLGKKQSADRCKVVYSRCAFDSNDIVELMRQRGTSLDLPIGQNYECTVLFLWHHQPRNDSLQQSPKGLK